VLTHGSLFAGIGGFDLGFERAGIETVWTVEKDANCNQVLATHWPNVRRHTDVKEVGRHNLSPVDIISGGFPCQDLSVAGRREGLAGDRSGLWFEFARIVGEMAPQWVVVENVPGLFSSEQGEDFLVIVEALDQLRHGVSWRVFDSRYFNVAQRRERVFIVGSLGDMRSAEILFEPEGGEGDSAEGGKEGKAIAYALAGRSGGGSQRYGDCQENYVVTNAFHGYTGGPDDNDAQAHHLVFDWQSGGDVRLNVSGKHTSALSRGQTPAVCGPGVRRLTPTECERLQGFPDGWTEGLSDSARYRCLGNAVTVNVAEWIGKRLVRMDDRP